MKTRSPQHQTLPKVLQDIVLSYIDPEEEVPQEYIRAPSFEATQMAYFLPVTAPIWLTNGAMTENMKIEQPVVRTTAQLATLGVGLTATIVGAAVGAVAGTVTGLTELSMFGGKKMMHEIKELTDTSVKNAVNEISYYVDQENLLQKIR